MAPDQIATLMGELRAGDHTAAEKLIELFYPELRNMAAAQMRAERSPHTWQPTALVHELYLQLIKWKALQVSKARTNANAEKAAFLALAATVMRRLLIMHSRPLYRHVQKTHSDGLEVPDSEAAAIETLQEVEAVLSGLAAMDPKLRAVVEMKVFEGLTTEQIAQNLDCSERTVARHWEFVKHWLAKNFAGHDVQA